MGYERENAGSSGKERESNAAQPGNGKRTISRQGTRKLVQLYAALLYNANLKGFIDGHIYSGPIKSVCVPGFNCYSCPGAIASCPLGSLQNALNASGHTAPWYVLGILALFGVVLGRTICGWLCPLGLIQELLHKIPVPKIRKSRVTRALSYLKYVFLVVLVAAIPIWYGLNKGIPWPAFCRYICPAGTLEGAVGLLQNKANATSFYQLKILFTRKWVIMLVIGLACAFCYRTFCRFICPLGAIYGFFNRFALTGVRVDTDRCNGCGMCVRGCGMDVKHVGDHECISCCRCMDSCAQGAISLKAGEITLAGPSVGGNADPEPAAAKRRRIGRILGGAAIALLVFALVWFNWIEPARSAAQKALPAKNMTEAAPSGAETLTEPADAAAAGPEKLTEAAQIPAAGSETLTETETKVPGRTQPSPVISGKAGFAPVIPGIAQKADAETAQEPAAEGKTGSRVGEILPDFRTDLLGGGSFHLADFRGQVVILNFWGTTCAPCIEELPSYEKLKTAHPEVEILAIHHRAGAKKAEEFLADKGWDHLDFALDSKEKGLYALLEVGDALPATIVLNGKGEVTYNAQAPLSYEQLEALTAQAQ